MNIDANNLTTILSTDDLPGDTELEAMNMHDKSEIEALREAAEKSQLLTPEHPSFQGFCSRMVKALVWDEDAMKATPFGPMNSDCNHDFRRTVEILRSIPGIDVCETIRWFKEHSGDCDCGVVIQIAGGYWR